MSDTDRAQQLTTTTEFGSRFVIPLDVSARSEQVAELAAEWAGIMGAEPVLTSVVPVEEEAPIRKLYLRSVAQTLTSRFGVDVAASVDVAGTIGRTIGRSLTADTSVFMNTSSKLGLHDGRLGSISEYLVRHASRPCVLVGPRAIPRFDVDLARLIVPVDGSEHSERALPAGAEVARMLRVPLWIVTVITRRMQEAASLAGVDPVSEVNYVRGLAAKLAETGLDVEYDALHGETAATSILDYAGRNSAMVMSTHGRSGVMRLAMGSVTTEVVRFSAFPTVVVPPNRE